MPILTTDFSRLTDDLQSIFNEAAKRKTADMKGNQVFHVEDTNRLTYDHLIMHGLGGIEEVAEGQDYPSINTEQGDFITYTQRQFGGSFKVTKKMRKYDLYNQIRQLPKTLVRRAFDRIDQSMADTLLYGWSTTFTDVWAGTTTATGPDGLALFSSVHSNDTTSRTYSNLIVNAAGTADPVLSREAIVKTRANALVLKDPENNTTPVNLDTLIVSPSNEDLAERLLFSNLMSGTANNDTNALKGKIKNLIVWERLQTRSDSTDTSNYWFMMDSSGKEETLKALFAERPTLDAPEEVYINKNWVYSCDFDYVLGIGYQAYLFGSRGTVA